MVQNLFMRITQTLRRGSIDREWMHCNAVSTGSGIRTGAPRDEEELQREALLVLSSSASCTTASHRCRLLDSCLHPGSNSGFVA